MADDVDLQLPALQERAHVRLVLLLREHQHPLLRLRQHHLVRNHAALPPRHQRDVDFDAVAGASPPTSTVELVRPAAPRSWMPSIQSGCFSASSRQASMSSFSMNGLPTCTVGRSSALPSSNTRDASTFAPPMPSRPVSAPTSSTMLPGVAARPDTRWSIRASPTHMAFTSGFAEYGLGEADLAGDGRDAQAVAVAADAADDAAEEIAIARLRERPEAQRVEGGDWPRAHREDVAHDAADAGRGAFVRLDGRRVVVRLDLHHDADAVADVDRAGVLAAHAREDARAAVGEQPQERLAVLIAAVLAPHRAEHAELDLVRLAAQLLDDQAVLLQRQRQLFDQASGQPSATI